MAKKKEQKCTERNCDGVLKCIGQNIQEKVDVWMCEKCGTFMDDRQIAESRRKK